MLHLGQVYRENCRRQLSCVWAVIISTPQVTTYDLHVTRYIINRLFYCAFHGLRVGGCEKRECEPKFGKVPNLVFGYGRLCQLLLPSNNFDQLWAEHWNTLTGSLWASVLHVQNLIPRGRVPRFKSLASPCRTHAWSIQKRLLHNSDTFSMLGYFVL